MEQSKLASIRRYHDVSQEFMGGLIKKSRETYRNKEEGKTQFTITEMFIISDYFQKRPEEIFLPPDFIKHEVKKRKSEEGVK